MRAKETARDTCLSIFCTQDIKILRRAHKNVTLCTKTLPQSCPGIYINIFIPLAKTNFCLFFYLLYFAYFYNLCEDFLPASRAFPPAEVVSRPLFPPLLHVLNVRFQPSFFKRGKFGGHLFPFVSLYEG